MHLSPHFTLTEMIKSQTALRRGLDNVPDAAQQAALADLCRHVLEPVRARFKQPILPSSGFRSLAVNRAVGGSPNSRHCRGEAVDFEIAGIANRALAEWIYVMLDFDQLILEYPDRDDPQAGWVHVSYCAGKNRNMLLSKTPEGIFPGFSTF